MESTEGGLGNPTPSVLNDKPPSMIQEVERRARLSDKEIGNLLSSFGNSEGIALVVTEMHPDRVYGRGELYSMINSAQGLDVGWKVSRTGVWNWCERSLAPFGIVERVVTEKASGYRKTEYGEMYGVPLAGKLLDFSLRHPEISLYELMGSTVTSPKTPAEEIQVDGRNVEFQKRASITRLGIFRRLLATTKPVRMTDLVENLGEEFGAVNKNIESLSNLGVVDYTGVKGGEPFVAYKLTAPTDIIFDAHQSILVQKMIKIMDENRDRWLSLQEIADEVMQDDPSYPTQSKAWHKQLHTQLSANLSTWRSRGFANSEGFQGAAKSRISLTSEQRILLTEFVEIMNDFQDRNPQALTEGRYFARNLTAADKSALMTKAEEASPFGSNRSSYEEMEMLFSKILEQKPGISVEEIRISLKEQSGKRLTRGGINSILTIMKKRGLTSNVMDARTNKWSLIPQTDVPPFLPDDTATSPSIEGGTLDIVSYDDTDVPEFNESSGEKMKKVRFDLRLPRNELEAAQLGAKKQGTTLLDLIKKSIAIGKLVDKAEEREKAGDKTAGVFIADIDENGNPRRRKLSINDTK